MKPSSVARLCERDSRAIGMTNRMMKIVFAAKTPPIAYELTWAWCRA
jgi:hypothetical protein